MNTVLATSVPDLDSKNTETNGDDAALRIQPNEDAIDFTDIQELAEDIAPKPLALAPTFFKPVPLLPAAQVKQQANTLVAVPQINGRLKFSEVFASHVATVPQAFRTKNLPGTMNEL